MQKGSSYYVDPLKDTHELDKRQQFEIIKVIFSGLNY
jgi:hypothetical protein